MGIGVIIVVAALTFGVCYLVDQGFNKIFRGKVQHATGLSVRLNKRYATIGLVLSFLGVCAIFAGFENGVVLIFGGAVVLLIGIGAIVFFLSFGIFYDDDSFIYTSFGKKSVTYRFDQINGQMLYNVSGNIMIELHIKDGKSVALQSTMVDVYPFLDHAFRCWCRQTGRDPEQCPFHDPDNSCWFPNVEGT